MAVRDRDWPGYTRWFCCQECGRLWTFQGNEVVALDPNGALGPALVGDGISCRTCTICDGTCHAPAAEI